MRQKTNRRKLQLPNHIKKMTDLLMGEVCGCLHRRDAHTERIISRDYKTASWSNVCQIVNCLCPGFETDNLKYLEKLKSKRDDGGA